VNAPSRASRRSPDEGGIQRRSEAVSSNQQHSVRRIERLVGSHARRRMCPRRRPPERRASSAWPAYKEGRNQHAVPTKTTARAARIERVAWR
jgi:hypothetical protein